MATALEEQLTGYITDALAMEENVDQMLTSMIATADDPEMRERLERHQQETRTQADRLRGRLEAHGETGSTIKEVAARVGAAAKGVLDMARGEKAGRNARDGYVTEHLEIAAYQLLERVATMAGDPQTAEVARMNRAEEEDMARFIDERWDKIAVEALREADALRWPWGCGPLAASPAGRA